MKTFWIRTASAAVYALLFLGSIFSGQLLGNPLLGIFILTAFALFVALGCTYEYFRMVTLKGDCPNRPLGYYFTILIVLCLGFARTWLPSIWVLGAGILLMFPITLMIQLWRQSEHPFADVLHTLLPAIYCGVPLGMMPYLQHSLLVMCVLMVWVNDSFAYMGGSLVGKHKMWPKHSPGKTWEGTAIGVLACVALGIFVGPLLDSSPSILIWVILGLICGVVGTLGDLVESMLKRSVGVKDSGNIMPGHGGFLDRFDSLLMILPFAFIISFFF